MRIAALYLLTLVITSVTAGLAIPGTALAADKRVALVVGNSAYKNTPTLVNPKNDAEDIAAKLTGMGFNVILGLDLDKTGMDRKIGEFAEALNGASVGVFFYGGHGLQVGGQNYLVPVDAKLLTQNSLDFEMVRLDLVQRAMERDVKTNIIFLDACRDNPLARNLARALGTRSAELARGLAPVESGIGTLISFSTQPGSVALDGEGRNSPFAAALTKHIAEDDTITDMLINVRNDVVAATNQQQVPWEHSALRAKFYFNGSKGAGTRPETAATSPSTGNPSYEQQAELALWRTVSPSRNPALFESFLDQFPNGRFAETARLMADLLKKEQQQAAEAERRQSDAAQASVDKNAAMAQELEANRKAEAAKRDADYKLALDEAQKAREAMADAERRRAEAETAAEVARKAAQATVAEREQKLTKTPEPPITVAALPEAKKSAQRSVGSDEPNPMTQSMQKELKRVGCYSGEVDGKWGEGTRDAIQEFADESKMVLSTSEPTEVALNVLTASKTGVCSSKSDSGEKTAQKSSKSRKQARSSSSRSSKSSGSGTILFGIGKGVGVGIGF
jgi:uncharacterized caspase-like protein